MKLTKFDLDNKMSIAEMKQIKAGSATCSSFTSSSNSTQAANDSDCFDSDSDNER